MSSLFKYCAPKLAVVVETLRIRFSPLAEFNDPFECLSDAKMVADPDWRHGIEDGLVHSGEYRASGLSEAEFRRVFRERYEFRIPVIKRIAHQQFCIARAPFRVLCLTRVEPNAQAASHMWAHYGEDHSGFAIEFSEAHEWVTAHTAVEGTPVDCGPVEYSDVRAQWEKTRNGFVPTRDFMFRKSRDWEREQEFRLLRFAGSEGLDASKVDSLVSFPPDLLRSVTFGVNTSDATKARVRAACARPELRHVKLRQAEIHPDEYRLAIVDDDPLPEAN